MSYAGIAVIRVFGLTVVALFGSTAGAQPIPVLTVCEALHDLAEYNGKLVIVVGRSFWTFAGSFLNEECGRDGKVAVQGKEWLSMIALGSMLDAPTVVFAWDIDALNRKLKQVQETTHIRESSIQVTGEGWSAICGRLEAPRVLRPPGNRTAGNGYGVKGSVPAQLRAVRTFSFPR